MIQVEVVDGERESTNNERIKRLFETSFLMDCWRLNSQEERKKERKEEEKEDNGDQDESWKSVQSCF